MRQAFVIAAALLLPVAVQAQDVRIAMGEEVAFTLAKGVVAGEIRGAATPDAFEESAGRMLSGIKPPEAPVTEGMPMSSEQTDLIPATEPGKLRFRFLPVAGTDHSLLTIYNGYEKALIYRARITARGRTAPTDVCLVMPGKPSVEHWPYAIDAVEVGGFELIDWKPADGVPCK